MFGISEFTCISKSSNVCLVKEVARVVCIKKLPEVGA